MEVSIISRETVKPSSLPLNQLKPYKLCLFDQITPMTYASIMVFFCNTDPNFNVNLPQTLAKLKKSFSETLTFFYPLSGRTKDNLYVDNFDAGVTYVEAKVNCTLTEFFKLKQNELLNQFVPFLPWRNEIEASREDLPQIGFQVNVFACGGIAIASSLGHKIADGGTLGHFLMSWATSFRGFPQKIIPPNLSDASIVFPPKDLPPKYRTLTDKLWYTEGNFVTERFVFDANAVATIRDIAKSERVPKPTRNEALTCFFWKNVSAAAAAVAGFPRASIVAHAANMRTRMKSNALNTSIGNLFWWARAASSDVRTVELSELVEILRGSLASFNKEYLESRDDRDAGFAAVSEFFDTAEEILNSTEPEKQPDIYGFTNWGGFFNEVDFGWGKPIWVGAHGKVGAKFRNLIVFVDAQGGKGIEAFVTLEESHMAALERDPKFLAFVVPNPEGLPVCML